MLNNSNALVRIGPKGSTTDVEFFLERGGRNAYVW